MELPFQRISGQYQVRRVTEDDLPEVLELAQGNPDYYRHLRETPRLESLREDLTKLPPRTIPEDKYFLGLYREGRLCAVLDLIARYPNPETAFIGWFILRKDLQGRGTGTAIMGELLSFLKEQGFQAVRLCYVKTNRESKAFWEKNRFLPTGAEPDGGAYTMVVMERTLREPRIPGSIQETFPHAPAGREERSKIMAKVTFLTDLCKGCGLCVNACPKHILAIAKDQINQKGYSPAVMTKQEDCIGCAFCATMCPDCIITVEK